MCIINMSVQHSRRGDLTITWGGYLEWATWPKHVVFVDGRFELHPSQVWFDYLDIVFPSARGYAHPTRSDDPGPIGVRLGVKCGRLLV